MVEADGSGEFRLLGQQRKLVDGGGYSSGGCGYSEARHRKTNRTQYTGSTVPDILALALPGEPNGLECTPVEELQSESVPVRKQFNPKVADYESGMEVLQLWLSL